MVSKGTPRRRASKERVKLECGHWVKTRVLPHPHTKLVCTSGMGCGYNLRWIEFQNRDGRTQENWKT